MKKCKEKLFSLCPVKRNMALDSFLVKLFICDFHVNCSSRITPRKVAS